MKGRLSSNEPGARGLPAEFLETADTNYPTLHWSCCPSPQTSNIIQESLRPKLPEIGRSSEEVFFPKFQTKSFGISWVWKLLISITEIFILPLCFQTQATPLGRCPLRSPLAGRHLLGRHMNIFIVKHFLTHSTPGPKICLRSLTRKKNSKTFKKSRK